MSACFRGYLTKGGKKDADEFRITIVKCLINAGAQVNHVTKDSRMTPLHWACYQNDYAVVQELLKSDDAPQFQFSE